MNHQEREHSVPCRHCHHRETWAWDALCPRCADDAVGAAFAAGDVPERVA